MQVVTSDFIQDKKVLLRLDIDVPVKDGKVLEDFRLEAAFPTLKLCLDYAQQVIIMGHLGRPEGEDPELSVAPIYDWLEEHGLSSHIGSGKLKLLENLRFENGESFDTAQDKDEVLQYARQLAVLGDVFVNEAFAAHHPAASTTVLPTLLPHAAGLRFVQEVETLKKVRDNPKRPLVAIIGGVKVEDKLPAVEALSKTFDHVLVGGKIVEEMGGSSGSCRSSIPSSILSLDFARDAGEATGALLRVTPPIQNPSGNILLGDLNEEWTDLNTESLASWREIIEKAGMIVWNGPVGKIEDEKNDATKKLAQMIMSSQAQTLVGGGDTVGYLEKLGLLGKFSFVSTGGGAMLEYLIKGTLPTIESLEVRNEK
ncbi:phosphoglycerate kinase [Candidatus Daviesbacteria bacterium]|nr:phosphoglycerate kinase [Candidatus Daviesbacteria bacterium]